MAIDTMNRFFVGVQGDSIRIMRPLPPTLSADEAVLLAAYLVTMSEMLKPTYAFPAVLEAVQGT